MSKLRQMYEGYKNILFYDEEIEKMAEERLKHCECCLEVKYIMRQANILGKKVDLCEQGFCGKCWCYIPALIRSPEKHCELGKF